MKKISLILALCLLLSGCTGFMDGHYEWEESHPIEVSPGSSEQVSAANYTQLRNALIRMAEAGAEQGTIFVEKYAQADLDQDVKLAVADVCAKNPIAAYAVDEIICDLGTSGSRPALSVQITYVHDWSEIRRIKRAADNEQARHAIEAALITCETGIVMLIETYEDTDFVQLVENYATANPQYVMENPQVSVNVYPDSGKTRVVEMKFAYQTSRDSLKSMQAYVNTLFASAMGYVSADDKEADQFSQLYGFLMTRFDYKIKTSITPSYHLLRHGVGDSRAFACVYAAMCRQAGLECILVSGTKAGESWYWNIIQEDGVYYHVDLLSSKEVGEFTKLADAQMEGYVWDFSAYPVCGPQELPPEETENP